VNVLKEAVQCGVDDTLKFAFRRQFHPQAPQPFASRIKQGVRRVRLFRTLDAKPVFQILLVLRRRKTPAAVLTDLRQMIIKRAAVPRIGLRGIPQQAELTGDECTNLLWYLGHWVGHIAQMRDRFQKQRHATTVRVASAREHQLQLGRSQ
jgi:hypothetical protein